MKRKLSMLLSLVLALLLFAGCGKTAAPLSPEEVKQQVEEDWGFQFLSEIPAEQTAKPHPAAEAFAGGDGTAENPYQIENAEQLQLLSDLTNSQDNMVYPQYCAAHYILTADIDMNDVEDFDNWKNHAPAYSWTPIAGRNRYTDFEGSFDGNGHTIRGLYICYLEDGTTRDNSGYYEGGLIASVRGNTEEKSEIRNLTIEKSLYRIYNLVHSIGGIAGKAVNARFTNCSADVEIYCDAGYYMGGIAGRISTSEVTDCSVAGRMEAAHRMNDMAGIAGNSLESTFDRCSFTGTICAREQAYGMAGIAGQAVGGTIRDCVHAGVLETADSSFVGGIAGELVDDTEYVQGEDGANMEVRAVTAIEGCYNNGTIPWGGGIVGKLLAFRSDVAIRNCTNYGNVGETGTAVETGGIIGAIRAYGDNPETRPDFQSNIVVENCANEGSVRSFRAAGGLIGDASLYSEASLETRNCVNRGAVECEGSAGGLVGSLQMYRGAAACLLTDSENHGEVLGDDAGTGGIMGTACFVYEQSRQQITLLRCTNDGSVQGRGYGVGGILGHELGQHGGETSCLSIQYCVNCGDVTGVMPNTFAGGIVGYLPAKYESDRIEGCENNGSVVLRSEEAITVKEDNRAVYGCAGGIAGGVQSSVVIENCRNNGELIVDESVQCTVLTAETAACVFAGYEPIFGTFAP